MTPVLPQPKCPRYASLDAWRGAACLMVITVPHSTMYAGAKARFDWSDPSSWFILLAQWMWIGVPIFFVISGYCIAATADCAAKAGCGSRTILRCRFRANFSTVLGSSGHSLHHFVRAGVCFATGFSRKTPIGCSARGGSGHGKWRATSLSPKSGVTTSSARIGRCRWGTPGRCATKSNSTPSLESCSRLRLAGFSWLRPR